MVTTTGLPSIGELVPSAEAFNAMPLGTVIGPESHPEERYVKVGWPDRWHRIRTDVPPDNWQLLSGDTNTTAFSLNYNTVWHYVEEQEEAEVQRETLNQFKWRLREHVLYNARLNGIGMDPVIDALRELKLDPDRFRWSVGQTVLSRESYESLPNNTVVSIGEALWEKRGAGWRRLFGPANPEPEAGTTATIESVGGEVVQHDWITLPPREDEEARMLLYKALVWNTGWKYKQSASWCGVYEQVMRGIGITASSVQEARVITDGHLPVSTQVNTAQAAACPVGTVFIWSDTGEAEPWNGREAWALYVRDDEATNNARTRRLTGNRGVYDVPLYNWRGRSRIWSYPEVDGQISIPEHVPTLFRDLPVGSSFQQFNDTSRYVITGDHRASPWQNRTAAEWGERTGRWEILSFTLPIALIP